MYEHDVVQEIELCLEKGLFPDSFVVAQLLERYKFYKGKYCEQVAEKVLKESEELLRELAKHD